MSLLVHYIFIWMEDVEWMDISGSRCDVALHRLPKWPWEQGCPVQTNPRLRGVAQSDCDCFERQVPGRLGRIRQETTEWTAGEGISWVDDAALQGPVRGRETGQKDGITAGREGYAVPIWYSDLGYSGGAGYTLSPMELGPPTLYK